MTPLRLEHCGDLLSIQQYSDWCNDGSVKATYNQLHRGGLLVEPHTLKPRPMWKRTDCEANLQRNDLARHQRADRARKKFNVAKRAKAS